MKSFIFALLLLPSILLSTDANVDSLLDLSLDELLTVEVVTVSQEKEKAAASLAVVSVITAKQLKQMGALNLYEALGFLPGVQITETYVGYTVLTFRGVNPGIYNNKALFMVNGHPVHEKLFGSSHLEFVPIDMVERIEVVRSPSSILYGTNAISGVVNVITKQGVEFNNQAALRAGSNDHYFGSLNIHSTNISMGASYQKDNGYQYKGTVDELGDTIDKKYPNDIGNVFVDIYGEGWRINASYFNSKKEKYGAAPVIEQGGLNEYEAYYLDVNKKFTIGTGTLDIWLRYDKMDKKLRLGALQPVSTEPVTIDNDVERYSGVVQFKDTLFDDLYYIVGASYEYDKSTPFLFIAEDGTSLFISPYPDKKSTNNYALYTQIQYRFNEDLVGVGGLRFEDNSDTGTGLVPRIGLNYEFIQESYFKVLYSEAFRSPVFVEKYTDVPGVIKGDINLKRESIQTLEVSVDSKINKKNSIQATLFRLHLKDEITRRPLAGGGTEYYNADDLINYGLELSLNSIIASNTELMLNASYVDGKKNSEDLLHVAKITANAILSYQFNQEWSGSLSDQYIGAKDYNTNGTGAVPPEVGSVDAYNLTNITLSYFSHPYEANLYVKNIFDAQYTYTEPTRQNIAETPGGPGISAYMTLRYYF